MTADTLENRRGPDRRFLRIDYVLRRRREGRAAVNLLTVNEPESAVDDFTLIYDLDETPAAQLTDR